MSEPPVNHDRLEPVRPDASRRVVPDWEYRTAYIQHFQVRIPVGLHDRLSRWAEQEDKPLGVLLVDVLENAVGRRT